MKATDKLDNKGGGSMVEIKNYLPVVNKVEGTNYIMAIEKTSSANNASNQMRNSVRVRFLNLDRVQVKTKEALLKCVTLAEADAAITDPKEQNMWSSALIPNVASFATISGLDHSGMMEQANEGDAQKRYVFFGRLYYPNGLEDDGTTPKRTELVGTRNPNDNNQPYKMAVTEFDFIG